MAIALGLGIFFIGIPMFKILKALVPRKYDPLKEAKEKLELARKEAEAARLNKEAERLYEQMYNEALEEQESIDYENQNNRSKR